MGANNSLGQLAGEVRVLLDSCGGSALHGSEVYPIGVSIRSGPALNGFLVTNSLSLIHSLLEDARGWSVKLFNGQSSVMDASGSWSVESKKFEVRIKGGGLGVRIYESSKKKKSTIFTKEDELTWLVGALEEVVDVDKSEVFWDQS